MKLKPSIIVSGVVLLGLLWCVTSGSLGYEKKSAKRISQGLSPAADVPESGSYGDYCDIYNDLDNPAFYWPEFDSGMGFAVHMDPSDCGASPYPFLITNVLFYLYEHSPSGWRWPVRIQVNVRDVVLDDECLGPQSPDVLCSELFTIPIDSSYVNIARPMNLTLTSLCCVDQPFFLEIQYVDHSAEGDTLPSLLMDNIDPPPDTCDNWIFWYGDYYEWYDVWSPPVPGDAIIRAAGYTESEDCAPLVCPEDSNDRGLCDTMYVEPWPPDTILEGTGPHSVRVPIFVTNDVVNHWDSICSFIIPLCYSHTNLSAYCSLTKYWNNSIMLPVAPGFDRSIFRHIVEGTDTLYHNRMAQLEGDFSQRGWDFVVLDLDGTSRFWFAIFPVGNADQLWWEGSRVLLATMTFRVEDTMQVCIDTCFWPPANHLAWDVMTEDGSNVISKVPRMGSPHDAASYRTCFNVAPFVNNAPEPFSLLFPPNKAFAPRKVRFIWESTTDPDSADQIRYDLYVSTSRHFHPDSTTVDSNLVFNQHSKKFDLGFYYWKVRAKDDLGAERWSNETLCFVVTGLPHQTVGDFNSDERVDLADVVFAINYLYRSGPPPEPLEVGDCNCDGAIDLGDVVHLLNYLFKSGMAPGC